MAEAVLRAWNGLIVLDRYEKEKANTGRQLVRCWRRR